MQEVRWYELNDGIEDFLNEVLTTGLALSLEVASITSLSGGKALTPLPEGMERGELASYFSGGRLISKPAVFKRVEIASLEGVAVRTPNTGDMLIDLLKQELLKADTVVILEQREARPRDPGLKTSGLRILVNGENVYFGLLPGDGEELIRRTVKRSTSLPFSAAFICTSARLAKAMMGGSISDLRAVAQSVDKLIVLGVYDGESFIVWERA